MHALTTLVPLGFFDGILGFLNTLMWPVYWLISGLLVLFHWLFSPLLGENNGWTWVLSIIALTVVVRIALIPLFLRQLASQRKMQVLAPKMKQIREKHKGDPMAASREMQVLYREEGVNPASSCLPLLLQFPIMIGLLRVLNGASRGISETEGKWLEDRPDLVASLQHSTIFDHVGLANTFLPMTHGFTVLQAVAAVLIAAMAFLQFWAMRESMQKNMNTDMLEGPMKSVQGVLLWLAPMMAVVGGLSFPIGVLIYWTFSAGWSLAQQAILMRHRPTPETPAYALWEARMIARGKDPRELDKLYERREAIKAETAGATSTDVTPPRTQPRKQTRAARKGSKRS